MDLTDSEKVVRSEVCDGKVEGDSAAFRPDDYVVHPVDHVKAHLDDNMSTGSGSSSNKGRNDRQGIAREPSAKIPEVLCTVTVKNEPYDDDRDRLLDEEKERADAEATLNVKADADAALASLAADPVAKEDAGLPSSFPLGQHTEPKQESA